MNNRFSLGQPVRPASGPGWEGRIIGIYDSLTGLRYAVQRHFGKINHYYENALMPVKQKPVLVMVKGGKYDAPISKKGRAYA